MTRINGWLAVLRHCMWFFGAGLVLLGALSGCAAQKPKSDGANESYTASDIPETRKRATNRLQLAVLYFNDGKMVFAMDEIKQAINADPDWFEPYWMRGLIQMQNGDNVGAEASLQKALSISPDSSDLKHNYGVLLCRMGRPVEGLAQFESALANPAYGQRAKTLLERGSCQLQAGNKADAEASFLASYKLDPANAATGYKLATLLFERNDDTRAQFYIRRINNSDKSSAESLWLGMKVERRLGNAEAVAQLGSQLSKRFGTSREAMAYERGAFDE